jgi:hypothetical protein
MRSNDEAIANNTANYTPEEIEAEHWGPQTKEQWRQHGLAMDEQAIIGGVEGMLAAGAKAQLMDLLAEIIKDYRLDRFVGRIALEEMDYEECAVCSAPLKTKREDAVYCSTACRMVAYRRRQAE